MATTSHDIDEPKRDHPMMVTGIIMAVLLVALLALPFVSRLRHHQAKAISVSPSSGVAPTAPGPVRDF